MKRNWAIRKDAEGVSPVIATILMVAITVVLAAVLYVMVLGFGGTSTTTPGMQITSRTAISSPEGYKFLLSAPTKTVAWTDLTIILQTGTSSGSWTTADALLLDNATVSVQHLGSATVGVAFTATITDMGGNGEINLGDYIVISGAFTPASYTVTLQDEATQGAMVSMTWSAT